MKPLIIGITGGSGSGKTSFIREIKASFDQKQVCVVSQDDYYFPRQDQQKDAQGVINFDLPDSIDKAAFNHDLKKLIAGETVKRQEYVFNNPLARAKTLYFTPTPIIIVEGLFVFHYAKIREKLDLKIFIHAKENLKVIRRIKRDRIERNYPIEDVLYRYENHVLPAYEKYIHPYREEADLIVNNNHQFEKGLQVVTGFIRNYLDAYQKSDGPFPFHFFEEE